jgi:FKBP12-rapamycin complex-associated protein
LNNAEESTDVLPPNGRRFSSSEGVTAESQSFRTFSSSRKVPNVIVLDDEEEGAEDRGEDVLNAKAVTVIQRVSNKLSGRDFKVKESLGVKEQVQMLILQATSIENLCQCYIGWCSFW